MRLILLTLLVCAICAPARAADSAEARKAMQSLLEGIRAENTAAVREKMAADANWGSAVEAFADQLVAQHRLRRIALEKFGEAAGELVSEESSLDGQIEAILKSDRSEIRVEGDRATACRVAPTTVPADAPPGDDADEDALHLIKTAAGWKLDINEYLKVGGGDDKSATTLHRKLAAVYTDVAQDISSGRIHTIDEARQTLGERLGAAIVMEPNAPSTRP